MAFVTHGEPFQSREGGWFRHEYADGYPAVLVRVLAPNDHSYLDPTGGYKPECGDCWLGFAHSRLVHETNIGSARVN